MIFLGFFMASTAVASAALEHVTRDAKGKHFQYDSEELLESYVLRLLGGQGKIYEDYAGKEMTAFYDEEKGYIDYGAVLEAYAIAIIQGKTFDLNKYIASDGAQAAAMPDSVWLVSLGQDNKLVYTEKHLDPLRTAMTAVNGASGAAEMQAVLLGHAETLGLDLTEYNKLNSYGKGLIPAGVLEGRPVEGFTGVEGVQEVFNAETAKAKALLEQTLEAVNNAYDPAGMMAVILDKAKILEISTKGYNELRSSQKNQVAEALFPKKPFSSLSAVNKAFTTAVTAAQASINIFYTTYNLTLEEMLDIQMTKSPQTDLYGGGWKNALREDVEYYLNPKNFVDPDGDDQDTDMLRITASPTLNVRERATTESNIVTTVSLGEVFVIEGAAEAEAGTAAGTEGTWYCISANGQTGWVSGRYVEVLRETVSSSMYQFLVLSGEAGVSVEDLGSILKGKGILDGTESSFLEGSRQQDINEIFLVSLALHETGNGRSTLANGIEFEDRDNLFPDQETVKVYNMFGIGAYDSNPNYLGAQYAYKKRWFTPELAILGGAEFTSVSYINSRYRQNTLYKMRWNPGTPGRHQYATDIGWALKQTTRIKVLYDQCSDYILEFDIPRYKE